MIWDFLTAGFGGFFKALFARLFGKPKDSETVEAEHEASVAEKQAAIIADRSRPDAARSLHDGTF